MFAALYLVIASLAGRAVLLPVFRRFRTSPGENRFWTELAASFGCGTVLVTWAVYLLAFFFHAVLKIPQPLLPANAVVLPAAALLAFPALRGKLPKNGLISDPRRFRKEALLYGALLLFLTFTMFYVFRVKDGAVCMGYTVFSDYSPHTAMIRSFSLGANYPTQYPHFGGEDVKYHFLFQFLCGNLEYLGFRLDLAFNVPSILGLLGFLILLSQLGVRLYGRLLPGAAAVVLFFFRSGTAFFRFLYEGLASGELGTLLAENTSFIGYTPNENWGLWNYNVYLNQRHLGFALLIGAFVIRCFLPLLEAGVSAAGKGPAFFRDAFAKPSFWRLSDLRSACLLGLFLGALSFWNGAVVIGTLLILFGMAMFSSGKLDYLVTAVLTVLLSFVQTKLFIRGSAVSPAFYFGFISEDRSLAGVLLYLAAITGLTVFGLLLFIRKRARLEHVLIFAFLLPLLFAFTASLTPDVTVNHKYIMISCAYLGLFWGKILSGLLGGKVPRTEKTKDRRALPYGLRIASAGVLLVLLTATGLYDFAMILRGNAAWRHTETDLSSDTTAYLAEETGPHELLLTGEYTVNEVTLSGRMMYCGWPYYAWSAGYDTALRGERALAMYTTDDPELLDALVTEEGISCIVYEEGMTISDVPCREDVIASVYPLVFTSADGRFRIYRTAE